MLRKSLIPYVDAVWSRQALALHCVVLRVSAVAFDASDIIGILVYTSMTEGKTTE